MSLGRRMFAEFLGTFWLVFAGCGTAVLAAKFPEIGVGALGVALAFGLSLLTAAYAIGRISGCHVNPAVTLGLAVAKRFPGKEVVPYWVAQVIGAAVASTVLYLIASGASGFSASAGFAANGYAGHSPGGYTMVACLISETVLTFMFVTVILGVTDTPALAGFAPIAIGLALAAVHLIGIPVTNLSVNPARSTGPALFVGGWALAQLWFFWVFPLLGGLLAGLIHPLLKNPESA